MAIKSLRISELSERTLVVGVQQIPGCLDPVVFLQFTRGNSCPSSRRKESLEGRRFEERNETGVGNKEQF